MIFFRSIIVSLIALIFCINLQGQELRVRDFEELTRDLTARTQPRVDEEGIKCALIKVQLPISNVQFKGDIVGNIEFHVNEYWVYMSRRSTVLTLNVPSCSPMSVIFANFGIEDLQSETAYNLIIDVPDTHSVTFKEEENGFPLVDLGLSVKWAKYNIGATRPEEYGDYYAWGEIAPKKLYTWKSYKYSKGSEDNITKYNKNDNTTTLDSSDDVAHIKWGGNWRMPTEKEFRELKEECLWEREVVNNKNCFKATGPNGNFIYFPAAGSYGATLSADGWYNDSKLFSAGIEAIYWTSTIGDHKGSAFCFSATCDNDLGVLLWVVSPWRFCGNSIRPVCR